MSSDHKKMMKGAFSGVFATVFDLLLLVLFVELLMFPLGFSVFFASMGGGVISFLLSKFWAFGDQSRVSFKQIYTFAAVALVTAFLVALGVSLLSLLPYLFAKGISQVLVFLAWSFPAQKKLVFIRRKDKAYVS